MNKLELDQHNRRIIDEFRAHDGVVGGMYDGMTLLLLHTSGARTGEARVNPMICLPLNDDRFAVFAANAGGPKDPAWYHNLRHHPEVEVEVGTTRMAAVARVVDGQERQEIWDRQIARVPHFAELDAATKRTIPVIVLERRARTAPGSVTCG